MNSTNLRNAILLTLAGGLAVTPAMANGKDKPIAVEEIDADKDPENITDIVYKLSKDGALNLEATGKGWSVEGEIVKGRTHYNLVKDDKGNHYIARITVSADETTLKRPNVIPVKSETYGNAAIFHAQAGENHWVWDSNETSNTGVHKARGFKHNYNNSTGKTLVDDRLRQARKIIDNALEGNCVLNAKEYKVINSSIKLATNDRFELPKNNKRNLGKGIYNGLKKTKLSKLKSGTLTDEEIQWVQESGKDYVCTVAYQQNVGQKGTLWENTIMVHGINPLAKQGALASDHVAKRTARLSKSLDQRIVLDDDNLVAIPRPAKVPGFENVVYVVDEFAGNLEKTLREYKRIESLKGTPQYRKGAEGFRHVLDADGKVILGGKKSAPYNKLIARNNARVLEQKSEIMHMLAQDFGPHWDIQKMKISPLSFDVSAEYAENEGEDPIIHPMKNGALKVNEGTSFTLATSIKNLDSTLYPNVTYRADVWNEDGDIGSTDDLGKDIKLTKEQAEADPFVTLIAYSNGNEIARDVVPLRVNMGPMTEKECDEIVKIIEKEVEKRPNKPFEFGKEGQPFVNTVPAQMGFLSAYMNARYGVMPTTEFAGESGLQDASDFQDAAALRHMLGANALIRGRIPVHGRNTNFNIGLDLVGGVDSNFGNMSYIDITGNTVLNNGDMNDGDYLNIIRGYVGGGLALELPNINTSGVDLLLSAHGGPVFGSRTFDQALMHNRELVVIGDGEGKGFFTDAEARLAVQNFALDLAMRYTKMTEEIDSQTLWHGQPQLNPAGSDTTRITRTEEDLRLAVAAKYLFGGLLGPYAGGNFEHLVVGAQGPDGTNIFGGEGSDNADFWTKQVLGGLELDLGKYFAARAYYAHEFLNEQHSVGMNLWTLNRQLGLFGQYNFDPNNATPTAAPTIVVGIEGTFDMWRPGDYKSEMAKAETKVEADNAEYEHNMNTDLGNGIVCNPNGAEKMCEYDVMDVCNTQHEDSCRYATEEEKTKLGGEITLDDVAPKAE